MIAALAGLWLGGYVVHSLAAQALIDHGVAGALLAGGGGWGTIAAAAGFLVLRLVCFVGVAVVPAWLVWKAR